MSDFEVRGAENFIRLSKALKQAGRTELRKELNKGLKDATKPLIPLTRARALSTLPSRGGLASLVARSPQRVQVRTGRSTAGVRIVAGSKGSGARGADSGTVRHPVFGNRAVYVSQPVQPGWFTETLQESAPVVRPEVEAALERIVQQVISGAR